MNAKSVSQGAGSSIPGRDWQLTLARSLSEHWWFRV